MKVKRFLVLIVALGCLVLNLSHSSAERWVVFSGSNEYVPTREDRLMADLDSVSIDGNLNCTLKVVTTDGWFDDIVWFDINYDTKEIYQTNVIAYVKRYDGENKKVVVPRGSMYWNMAVEIWEAYFNKDFMSESDNMRRKREAEEAKKTQFNSLVAQGDKFYEDKNYSAAIDLYTKANKINSEHIDEFCKNLVKNGDNLDEQGQHLAALDYYKKASTMNPLDNYCRHKLWETYCRVKNFDDAVSFYNVMTKVYYKNSSYWFQLAYSYDELGNYENAVTAYTNAIEFNPNNAVVYNNRGVAYKKLGQYERAIQDFNKTIELNPNYDKAYNNRGETYFALGQYERAIQDFNKKIKFKADAYDYDWRGLTYEKLKEYKKALKDYQKALKLDPNNEFAQKGIERVSKMK